NYNTLSKGAKSDEVLDMQNRLYQLGFLLDDRDGAFGSNTQTAVKMFQQSAGLPITGIADNETLTRMYADDAPRTEYAQPTPTPVVATSAPEATPDPAADQDAAANAVADEAASGETVTV
ncbi:MAG: peptidoglycan-binding domain-containing protein, partial [Christensenellales bacterium]|nr:peptidoglycan-binding domain-containing protein [Christensenellales bacterium]